MKIPLVLLITLAAVVLPARAGRSPAPTLTGQCPAFDYVDRSRLPTHSYDDPDGPSLDAIWSDWANERSDILWRTTVPEATIHLETRRGGLSISEPSARVIFGRRAPAGWEAYAREGELGPEGLSWTLWREVRLPRASQTRMDAVLEDPCLWSAPRFLEQAVALKNGRYDSRPDGPFNFYDLTLGTRRWGGMHFSWTVGTPAQLRAILLSEVYGEPEFAGDEIGPDGWLDEPQ